MRWVAVALLAIVAGCSGEIIYGNADVPGEGLPPGDDSADSPSDDGTAPTGDELPDDLGDDGTGDIEENDDPPPVDIVGPSVLAHVQAFADAACADIGSCEPSTYSGHSPVASRAIDSLVSDVYGEYPSDGNALGDRLAKYALDHQDEFGITYVIWRQRYNPGSGWSSMENRGSVTQNHYDHVHVSFDLTP